MFAVAELKHPLRFVKALPLIAGSDPTRLDDVSWLLVWRYDAAAVPPRDNEFKAFVPELAGTDEARANDAASVPPKDSELSELVPLLAGTVESRANDAATVSPSLLESVAAPPIARK